MCRERRDSSLAISLTTNLLSLNIPPAALILPRLISCMAQTCLTSHVKSLASGADRNVLWSRACAYTHVFTHKHTNVYIHVFIDKHTNEHLGIVRGCRKTSSKCPRQTLPVKLALRTAACYHVMAYMLLCAAM